MRSLGLAANATMATAPAPPSTIPDTAPASSVLSGAAEAAVGGIGDRAVPGGGAGDGGVDGAPGRPAAGGDGLLIGGGGGLGGRAGILGAFGTGGG